jgi:DNA polymerase-1
MLVLIDGNNLAHRCRHVFSLSNKGIDVSVTYGFLRVMGSILHHLKGTSVIVAWDGGVPEFRRQTVPEYKANRHHDDEDGYHDFLRQIHELSDYVLPMAGVLSVRNHGSEADDLLYHAAKISLEENVVVTSDKDLFQAIGDMTSVYNPSREKLYTKDNFEREIGVSLANYVDWRAIQGDPSDNIPGVYGVGEKIATRLFQDWGNLTSIVNAAAGRHPKGKLSGKVADSILSFGFEQIIKNVYITALYADRTGAKLALLSALEDWTPADKTRLKKYLMRNAFSSLLDPSFLGTISKLKKPTLRNDIRVPVVCQRRTPVL